LLAQKIRLDSELLYRDSNITKTNTELQELHDRTRKLATDTTNLGTDLRAKSAKLEQMDKEYNQLNAYYKNLLTSSGKLNRDMAQQQEQLLAIQSNLDRTRKMNDSLSVSLNEREKKVKELENIMAAKDQAVQKLKNSISNALLNFKENDLTVKVKNGKVYVSLAEQLLFASGSTNVDAKGVSALQQLAKALKDQRDIHIMVEGHTDNVPISKKSQYMDDNWDLSVMRATAITKILTKGGLSPKQITAAGKGEFSPLTANDSPQNKSKNRRTEIIITPNLDELFKILEAN
jgi:chemotaxis protein MotB